MITERENPRNWIGKEFECDFHPPGVVTMVFDVNQDTVHFGWFGSTGEPQRSYCKTWEFARDFSRKILPCYRYGHDSAMEAGMEDVS